MKFLKYYTKMPEADSNISHIRKILQSSFFALCDNIARDKYNIILQSYHIVLYIIPFHVYQYECIS